jgi:hypothetical protein
MLKPGIMKPSILLGLALLLATCSNDEHTCSVNDPAQDLPWLKETIESYKTGYTDVTIEQGRFVLNTVFIITPCCLTCRSIVAVTPWVRNCEGKVMDGLSANDERIKGKKLIWKTPDDQAECW